MTRARPDLRSHALLVTLITAAALLWPGARALAQGSTGTQRAPVWAQPPQQQTPAPSAQGVPAWAQPQRPPQQQPTAQLASPVIVRVGGRPSTEQEFARVAEPYFRMLRLQLGPSFAGDVQRMATFNVLDELIRRELLALEAQRLKIQAAPEDVDSLLAHDPYFFTDGKFDAAKFNSYKTAPGSNYMRMLPQLREAAAVRKLDESLRKRFSPTPAQLREEWARRNDQVRLRLLPLLTRDMSLDPEASEAEWAQYYQAHPDQFTRKTRARLRYARLPLPPEGDSSRATAETQAMARGRAIADSLRQRVLPDTSAELTDSGLFDLPAPAIPGIGRVTGLTDTLALLDVDSTIRVVGPYPGREAVIVGAVTERRPKHVPPMREVLGDVKRRADVEKRRTANETDRLDFYQAHRERWRGRRAGVTRLVLDPSSLAVSAPGAAEVDRWYAQLGHSLFGIPDTSRAWLPPITDSLRTVVRERITRDERAQRGAEAATRMAAAFRTARDPWTLAKANGAVAETLAFMTGSGPDTLFGRTFIDSLLVGAPTVRGVAQGPRAFGTRWIVWRVDYADTSFVPPYEAARNRSDQEFAESRRVRDEDEARTYFDQHRTDYRTPVRYGLDYVLVRVPSPDSVRIPEAEIRRTYDANQNAYRQEEQVKARHILFMIREGARDASPDAEKKAKARADSLLAAIRKDGSDFAELARRFSQEPGASTSGGDLGWFGRGRMVKEFEEAAFALKPGEVSQVVRTQFGYHIIKVEDHRAAGVRPYSEMHEEIRTQMAQARGDSIARRSAATLRRKLAAGGDTKALSARYGGVATANPIAPNDALPAIGFVEGLAPELPKLVVGKWAPHVYRAGNAWMALRVREVVPQRPTEFDEVKAQTIEDMKNAKRRLLLDGKVAAIRSGLTAGATLDSLAAPYGGLKDTGFLSQTSGFLPGVGNEPRVVARAFAMKPGELTDTLQVTPGVAWMRLEEKKSGDPATYKTATAQIEAEMVKKKYDAWVEAKKKSVTVEILRADLKGPRPNPFGGMSAAAGR